MLKETLKPLATVTAIIAGAYCLGEFAEGFRFNLIRGSDVQIEQYRAEVARQLKCLKLNNKRTLD